MEKAGYLPASPVVQHPNDNGGQKVRNKFQLLDIYLCHKKQIFSNLFFMGFIYNYLKNY